jgi:hypothetical protein
MCAVETGAGPRALTMETARHIGLYPTTGIEDLVSRLLPECRTKTTMCHEYLRKLLLSPPPYKVADTIHAICDSLSKDVTQSLPSSFHKPLHPSHVVQVRAAEELRGGAAGGMRGRGACTGAVHTGGDR